MDRLKRIAPFLKPLLILALFAVALRVLHDTLAQYRYRDVIRYLEALPIDQVLLAAALTLLGYLVMTGYDTLAFRYIRHPLPYFKIALASFIGYAFNNNAGFSGLVGGSLRYRLYNAWRLTAVEIAKVIAFCTVSFWLGFVLLGGIFFLTTPPDIPPSIHIPFASIRLLGIVLLLPAIAYMLWIAIRREPVRIKQWEFELPSAGLFVAQVATSCLDWIIAASVLYILLPDSLPLTFGRFVGIFLLAQIAGVASNVPGGIGIFEAIILVFLAPFFSASAILGALVAFRVIYYLLPLLVAILLLATHEIVEKREGVVKAWRIFGRWAPGIAPQLLAFTTFVGGAVLLFSGATPTLPGRIGFLRRVVPLPVVELSHFFGSIAGAALLLLARGLQRRLDAAYHLTVVVLGTGILFQIFKGGDFEEAIILAVMLFALVSSRRHFYRKASLLNEGFGPGWIAAILLVLISSAWLGFFSYKHVEYSRDLWWRFSFRADAPRFLRASVGVIGLLLLFSIQRLLRPASEEPDPPTIEEVERAAAVIADEKNSQANLALLGDKPLLFSPTGKAFLMYGVEGRSWIAMGDPIGADDEKQELIWRFRELCDLHAGWPVFYEVQRQNLHFYLDLGLTLLKIGEEARVKLDDFSLDGGDRKWMRKMLRRVEAESCTFEIVDAAPIVDELRVISDSWLAEKRTREKGFSLGFFAERYVSRCAVAIVKKDDRIVAFANLWEGAGEELSVDLMRHLADAPSGVMDYMFVNLILWGQQRGYSWFNLGMAPLSGLENRSLGTLWNRVGALAYRFGENFYNFQGLRQYKEKFDPQWEPMYLASPGGLVLPRILTNLAALISGGLRGVISK
ncbi:MAG TPA: bifunctional lysylphosphatidylglycerol flippase/synthetase MprF [Thermoanaerobaculia bacterium]|jgi:phosphatidylglycerol lysyltransferase|nr:bifunctional lysylphosphatidylglycerol flippase/synthetase MprF [Thermoanaerobaculia bacterium]